MRDKISAKTLFQMDRYLTKRKEKNGTPLNEREEQPLLAGWLASLAQAMDSDTLRSILMDYYNNNYLHMDALDVLSNPRIIEIETKTAIGPKFRNREE